MDSGQFDEGERVVEDEFTCSGMLRGSLESHHATVQRIFRVHFAIGRDPPSPSHGGLIWLKLRGLQSDVQAAKLFVKGVVNQEEQQEVLFPAALQCVFCGGRGLFMDCLIRTTSALIVMGSPGCLLVSGLMEPVVRALSLVTDLVERCESTQVKRAEPGERGLGESLDSRRAFKHLVEEWDDRHTLDLLVLPGAVKEILLELVKDARLGDDPGQLLMADVAKHEQVDEWEKSELSFEESGSQKGWGARTAKGPPSNLPDSFDESDSFNRGLKAAEEMSKSPQELSEEEQLGTDNDAAGDEQRLQLSGRKEFTLLLKFFTTMGYREDMVQRVLAKTGIMEASQILDLVQQEQDRTDAERGVRDSNGSQDGGAPKGMEQNRPCETEHREVDGKRQAVFVKRKEIPNGGRVREATGGAGELRDDDFVFAVLKKAAVSCGYNEKQVTEAYSMLPDRSMHDLLVELQKVYVKEGPREMDDVVVVEKEPKERFNGGHNVAKENRDRFDKKPTVLNNNDAMDEVTFGDFNQKESSNRGINGHRPSADLRGPPVSGYSTNHAAQFPNHGANQAHNSARPQSPHLRRQGFEPANGSDRPPTQTKGPLGAVVVTGEQRFLEGLRSRFQLRLTARPGNPKLRNIIIDGSNVAMSHGLGHFFSCRGIALAVQHFWDRGHPQINVLVPQWRTKIDPKITEQHYLTELKELGIVSFTPSREVQGKRISSYDDRFMLQLAEKTDGVIVTNDNLRDLLDESAAWRDIIKKRLLQYTFVGDLFMVPDDPLGRRGPHLDEFLSTEQRSLDVGSHVYGGTSAMFPPSRTDFGHYRDRSPGAAWGQGKDPMTGPGQNRPRPGWGRGRRPEETARLRDLLCQVFPGQDSVVTLLLQSHPAETDVDVLSAHLLELN